MADESPHHAPDSPPDLAAALAAMAASIARVADLIESRVVPALDRIASGLEGGTLRERAVSAGPDVMRRAEAVAAVRLAIAEGRWEQAESLAEGLAGASPDDPEAQALRGQVARGRDEAIDALRSRLDASQKVNDPESVIALHDELTLLLRGEDRRALEREVVRWLIGLLQRRLMTGTVRVDVVELAARVAERFCATVEGASVRASLPTLRRSAGLCPRCGGPYTGIDDACPRCLSPAAPPEAPSRGDWADPDEEVPGVDAESGDGASDPFE